MTWTIYARGSTAAVRRYVEAYELKSPDDAPSFNTAREMILALLSRVSTNAVSVSAGGNVANISGFAVSPETLMLNE
jgi:hypothetical protein